MKAIHRKRLRKLIRHLEYGKLGHPIFDFFLWNEGKKVNGCRTNGCAIGECPVIFPRQWEFGKTAPSFWLDGGSQNPKLKGRRLRHNNPLYHAAIFFGVSMETADKMFTPEGAGLSHRTRRKTVAKHLKKFL